MPEGPPIAVAMSGGVDSSVVAALLTTRQGHAVVGLTMQLWNQRRLPELAGEAAAGRCCSLEDVYDARHVAAALGIPYYVVNFEAEFERRVVQPFVAEYPPAGRTPVPCTLCNNYVKFDRFFATADAVGATHIATGHYARVGFDEPPRPLAAPPRRGPGQGPDLLPVRPHPGTTGAHALPRWAAYTKVEVRELARSLGLPVAEKDDSQEICFVPNGDYAAFLAAYLKDRGEPAPGRARRHRRHRRAHAGRAPGRPPLHRGPAPRPRHRRRRAALRHRH